MLQTDLNRKPQLAEQIRILNAGSQFGDVKTTCKRGHIVANDVFLGGQTGKHCCRYKMFLKKKTGNLLCVSDTNFASATNVVRAGKQGNIRAATLYPRLPPPKEKEF